MIIKIASVLISLCATIPVKGISHFRTAVAIKEAIQDFNHPIPIQVDNYIDFVRKSKLFVDTTLLIDDFVKMDLKPWLIVGPRRIGKTVNLDMLRTFFEIQVDLYGNRILPLNSTLTYKLFAGGQITLEHGKVEKLHESLLISSHSSLINDHLGKVPVIYVNFKDVTGHNYTEIEQHLRHAIGRAFEHHLYMINVLQKISQREPAKKSDLIRFKNIISENNQDDFKTSICFLSQLLSENFGRKPIIIFDDYDAPVTNTLSVKDFNDQDLNMVLKTIDTINHNTFQNNQHYWKAIVCGTFELEQVGESSTWDNFILQDITAKKDPSSFYFGFTHKDAKDLLEKCQIHADQLKQAHHWYGGYKASHSDDVFYNPHSIANFLKEKKIDSYFKLKEVQPILHKFVERKSPHTFALISKQTIAISSQIKINPNYLNFMKVPEGVSRCGYLWYLHRLGYLTYHNTSNTEFIHVKIPNNEIAMEMSHWLISHYQQQYGIKESILKDAANHLLQIVHNASSEAKPLEDSLTQLYNKCIIPDVNENSVQTIFNGIALEMQCLSKFLIDVYYNKILKADLVIAQSDVKQGGIINVRYDNDQVDNETSRLAESYERVFETVNYELNTLILLAVEVTPTKPIQVSVKLKRKPVALSTKTTISSNVVTKSNIDDPIVVQLPDNKRKKVKISISLQIQTSK